jgi:predicted Zn-dependent protease
MAIRRVEAPSAVEARHEDLPSWVIPREPDWAFEAPEGSPFALLLVDEQQHVPTQAVTNRIVRRLLVPAAVETYREVEIFFDPRARRVRVHGVTVWRREETGEWVPQDSVVSEAFREREGTDGERTSVVTWLDDLRVGDAIDVSWTLEPQEELVAVPFSAFHGFVWSVPCARTHFTFHGLAGAPLQWQLHCPAGVPEPEASSGAGWMDWCQHRPPVTPVEPGTPPGVWNFPVLEASCWGDWNHVAEHAAGLWSRVWAAIQDEIPGMLGRLRVTSAGNPAAWVAEAIRHVQEDLPFLEGGFATGLAASVGEVREAMRGGSANATTKAILLTKLLSEIGVEDVWPVLVNPDWHETVGALLPSAAVFNHVIVGYRIDGHTTFVDPSDPWEPTWHGVGLEVRPGVSGLVRLPERPLAELTLTETFRLGRPGDGGAVDQELHVTGWLAEEWREVIAEEGRERFVRARIESLRQQFPTLDADEGLVELRDGESLEMRGSYRIGAWGKPGTRNPHEFRYRADGLFLAVEQITAAEPRTVARVLPHPVRVRHVVRVEGESVRSPGAVPRAVDGPGFRYHCEVSADPGRVTFDHRWESTASRVEANAWPAYVRALGEVSERLEARVPARAGWTRWVSGRGTVFLALAAAGVAAAVAGIVGWSGARPSPEAVAGAEPPPEVVREVEQAVAAVQQGDLVSAEEVIETRAAHYAENADYQFLRAEVALRLGQWDRAREVLERGRALDPDNVWGDVLSARLLREQGDASGAEQVLAVAAGLHPEDPRPWREWGISLAQQGDPAGAAKAWARVLELAPDDVDTLRRYAVLLWENGERERADSVIQEALAAQSGPNAALEAAVGDYYTLTGRRAEALDRLEKAAALAPGDRARDFALAAAHLRAGRTQEALDLAAGLTEAYPADVRAWQIVAVARSILNDEAGAEAAFREWLRLAPQDPQGAANFGYFLHRIGRNEEARELLAASANQFPHEGVVWLNYAVVLDALGDRAAAAAAKEKADGLLTAEERQLLVR